MQIELLGTFLLKDPQETVQILRRYENEWAAKSSKKTLVLWSIFNR